jgi:hypothetical protein
MHMRMVMELAGPGVQHRQDAHLCTDKAFLCSQITYALGGYLHEQTIERFLMAQKQAPQLAGGRSDKVEIPARQDLGGSGLQPLDNLPTVAFGARPVTTAVVNPEDFITIIAVVAFTAHVLRHAGNDILQRPMVRGQHEITELLLIGAYETAHDIGQFELGLTHDCPLP